MTEKIKTIPVWELADENFKKLSSSQKRIWFLENLEPNKGIYNIPIALEVIGNLSEPAFKAALKTLQERHDALRVGFVITNNEPEVQVMNQIKLRYRKEDISKPN